MHLPVLPFGLIDMLQYPFIVTCCFRYLFDTFEYNLPSDVILYFPLVCAISFFSINSSMFLVLIISLFWWKVWDSSPRMGYLPPTVFKTVALIHLCQPSVTGCGYRDRTGLFELMRLVRTPCLPPAILFFVPKINHFSTQYFHVQLSEQVRQEHQRFIRWIQYCI